MKPVVALLVGWLSLLLLAGCATSTVESRRAERATGYAALSPELRDLVDRGQIKVGMPEDAVYIAWGKPSQVVSAEDESGAQVTWYYHGTWLQESRFWTYREVTRNGQVFLERFMDRDYQARDYLRAEIVFVNGVVKRWKTMPQPLQ